MQHNWHEFRENDNLNMQEYFIFVDTETYSKMINGNEELTFRLGNFIYWDRARNYSKSYDIFKISDFWTFVDSLQHEKLIVYAHNMSFDFKILNGLEELINRNWQIKKWYVKDKVFILEFTKNKKHLYIWDTMNYIQTSLREIGKSIGLQKLEVDFNSVSDEKLLVYCRRDVEIIFHFIKQLMLFLEENQLSRLMPTAGSLSLNIFRHKFYNRKKMPIVIHDWKKAIKLERSSYSGGICDCFQIGKINETVYKLDINSMYPFIMKNNILPVRLLKYSHSGTNENLSAIYELNKNKNLIIARCDIQLPTEFAYILNKNNITGENKSTFLSGNFEAVLCTPELNFVEKYGKIIKINEIAIYEGKIIYDKFVDFFYSKRLEFKAKKDFANEQFCKIILNSQYGKWGQKQLKQTFLDKCPNNKVKYFGDFRGENKKENFEVFQIGYKLFKLENTDENAKDSFVAISSFITSYARMLLINFILKAKRINVFYCDTDSIFTNNKGFINLKNDIDSTRLGALKLEEASNNVIINNPKDYVFGETIKIKGIKKDSIPVKSNDGNFFIYEQSRWEGFKTSYKKGHLNNQIIEIYTKEIKNKYNKGEILSNNRVKAFKYS